MKFNLYILLILILILSSCNQNKLDLSESNQDYHLTKSIVDLDESVDFIETSKEFELKHNEMFQQDLQSKSKEYYDNVIQSFVEEETGFFKLFGELWDRVFKSENERKLLWKLKIERYFRTTSFLTYIRNEVSIYTEGVNNQRKNGVSKVLGAKHDSNLYMPLIEGSSFNANNETVEKIIRKINEEINDQLMDIPADGILTGIILGIMAFVAVLSTFVKKSIGCFITIIFLVVFFVRSNMRQSEMKDILKTECYKTLNSTKIEYLDKLNKNTIGYYSQLQKLIYETNN
ncbi:hypothetical protein [Flavobacterium kayseriense]|nr:hypothetical protein [Flavobacterium kayseriense]MBC5849170.1 hypothetical protein [Flavobacterium kayseriense]